MNDMTDGSIPSEVTIDEVQMSGILSGIQERILEPVLSKEQLLELDEHIILDFSPSTSGGLTADQVQEHKDVNGRFNALLDELKELTEQFSNI